MQRTNRRPSEGFISQIRTAVEDRLADFDGSRLAAATLLGLILGLLVGLVIGWGLWPVDYVNAYPSDLSPDAKAQYIGAVADAYAASAGDPAALNLAKTRLLDLPVADIDAARLYFSGPLLATEAAALDERSANDSVYQQFLRPDGNIRVNNINRLAADLALPVGAVMPAGNANVTIDPQSAVGTTVVQNNGQTIIVQPNAAQPLDGGAVAEPPADSTNLGISGSTLGRVLAILTALMLVLGGVYILLRLNQRMNWLQLGPRSTDDLDYMEQRQRIRHQQNQEAPQRRTWAQESDEDPDSDSGPRRYDPARVDADTEFETDSFDEDDGDADDDFGLTAVERRVDIGPAAFSPYAPPATPQRSIRPEPAEEDEYFEARRSLPSTSYPGWETIERDAYAVSEQDSWDMDIDDEDEDDFDEFDEGIGVNLRNESLASLPVAATQPASKDSFGTRSPSSRPARQSRTSRELLAFTANYVRGQFTDYEERHQITMVADEYDKYGRNVGECGIGVNFKNGILQNKPYDLIALDVWLIDKSDQESLGNAKRLLLSEYAIDKGLESVIQRENKASGEPITPQAGLEFELVGNQLRLVCRVLEATYVSNGELNGIFDTLKVHMTVYGPL